MKIPRLVISLLGLLLLAGCCGRDSLDKGSSVQQSSDGGYVIAGSTSGWAHRRNHVYLIKTDAAGNEEWQKTFAGNQGRSVQQTTDGGYIIAGNSGGDVYLVKTDAAGNKEWQKTIGREEGTYYGGHSVQQTADGGYIIAGDTYGAGESDVYLVKTDNSGNVTWQKTFGGSDDDVGYSVQRTADGGYIIAGYTGHYGDRVAPGSDVYLVKTDAAGNEEWQQTFGGSEDDLGYSVQQTADGGYIIAGSSGGDVYLIKTDAAGNEDWQKTFAGNQGRSVQQTTDGGYIITGYSGAGGVYLLKTDATGKEEWQKTFGGDKPHIGHSVQQTTDGGYIIAGSTEDWRPSDAVYCGRNGHYDSDVYLIKTDAAGNEEWQKTFDRDSYNSGNSVQQDR